MLLLNIRRRKEKKLEKEKKKAKQRKKDLVGKNQGTFIIIIIYT